MEKNKKRMSVLILLLLVGVITIGYAALSANLTINGTSTINNASWNVHFKTVTPTTGSVTATTAPTIDGTGLNITYAVTLAKPGDFYEFTVVVENSGSIAAAMSALPTLSGVSTAQDVYTNYTITHTDGTAITNLASEGLAANGGTKSYKVRVEFDRNINNNQLPTTAQNMTLTVGMNYVQA